MTRSVKSLALRIALLLEDYSEREIEAAVSMLRSHGTDSSLLNYLAGEGESPSRTRTKETSTSSSKPLEESTSRAVLKLRDEDPEKYRVLSEFDLMVRRGQLLSTHENLRRFGERISKDFEPRKSRKDTIGALMAVIADRPLSEVAQLVEFAASFGVEGNTDDYQRLAQFLIKGKGGQV